MLVWASLVGIANCPCAALPQQTSLPLSVCAQLCSAPHTTEVYLSFLLGVGIFVLLVAMAGTSSCPKLFFPQHLMLKLYYIPQEKPAPAETED